MEPTMKEIVEALQKYRHDAVVPLASAARNSTCLPGTPLESALDNWCEKDKEILKIIDTCMAQVEAMGGRRCGGREHFDSTTQKGTRTLPENGEDHHKRPYENYAPYSVSLLTSTTRERRGEMVRCSAYDFKLRCEQWCKSTGLSMSTAQLSTALKFVPKYMYPQGFDHTNIFYWKPGRLHVVITEPYQNDHVLRAIGSVHEYAQRDGVSFSVARGELGTGLWYPGWCHPVLFSVGGYGPLLRELAMALPTTTDRQP